MEDIKPISALEEQTVKRISKRIIPFLIILFVMAFLDRTNIGFAALHMNEAIGITQTIFGLGAGIFFLGYFIAEVPSNILLHRFGARIWIARIMITWGIIAALMGFIQTGTQFIVLRFLLGIAEAGFFPGVIFYLTLWFPVRYRARVFAMFYLGLPIAQIIGAPVSVGLMQWGNTIGYEGWRLMYILEGIPSIILGIVCLKYLTNTPKEAQWLTGEQRTWLMNTLEKEESEKAKSADANLSKSAVIKQVFKNPLVWIMALVYFGITSGSNAMFFFLPSVLESFRNTFGMEISLIQNGMLTAIPYAFAAVGMILWSRRSDRKQERYWHGASAALMAAIAIAIALIVNQPWAIIVGFIFLAIGVFSAINIFWTLPGQTLTGVGAAAGIGLINSVGNLSGFTGPYLTGYLYTTTGNYTVAFMVIAGFVAMGGLGLILLAKLKSDSLKKESGVLHKNIVSELK
ncbi:MFS transporter [Acinetobacter terrestris]|jgi:MFS family permease|uniref:MFS transporter n=1 Tax=Acinetobacter terrestris TaxID=2529843 RepID=A0AAW6UXM0_9GAMM|nr:MFS transporter [Acinetobacter terrestris]MDK1685078.1 MFS transporter [Acinetobacter terrestris]NNH34708.1 MFS transporter [Acinetobacter terrestris]TCB50198.1 MFS transporter [Acinetobacter terrestris]TCB61614.1 MFS transporter [Acinetobacter terrestris]